MSFSVMYVNLALINGIVWKLAAFFLQQTHGEKIRRNPIYLFVSSHTSHLFFCMALSFFLLLICNIISIHKPHQQPTPRERFHCIMLPVKIKLILSSFYCKSRLKQPPLPAKRTSSPCTFPRPKATRKWYNCYYKPIPKAHHCLRPRARCHCIVRCDIFGNDFRNTAALSTHTSSHTLYFLSSHFQLYYFSCRTLGPLGYCPATLASLSRWHSRHGLGRIITTP